MLDSRARLLLLRDFFLENTDERHPATTKELIARLELAGCAANRRGIYADIALLRKNGMDIRATRRRANEYYLAGRVFERTELRLLADMVRASRLLSCERTEAMLDKLSRLTSRHEAALIRRPGVGGGLRKAANERAYHNAALILSALEHGRKLSFVCCAYTPKRTLFSQSGGEAIVVSPCLLIYAEDNYYLIAAHPSREGFAHYRLDRMDEVRILEETAAPTDAAFDAAVYAGAVFSMVPAEQRWVRLAFERQYTGAMIDRFGTDVPLEPLDERTYALFAPVRVSEPFFGWVFQFGGGVRILEPDDVRERMLLMLESARASATRTESR